MTSTLFLKENLAQAINHNIYYLGETIVKVSSSTELSLEFFEV
jgi:hypothetical protein